MGSNQSASLLGVFCLALLGCNTVPAEFRQVTAFKPVESGFTHQWHEQAHPFTTASVMDIDGDGIQEIFVGGGQDQADVLLRYDGQALRNVIDGRGLSDKHATYASAAIDIDNDGDTDLVVGRSDGLSLYLNEAGKFSRKPVDAEFPPGSVPLAITLSDIDHDGDADMYISMFVDPENFRSPVFNDPDHAKPNLLLLNEGSLKFRDITTSSGTAGKQNTFLSIFSDLDNDGWQDLLLAQNTGEVEIFRNNRDLTFSPINTGSGFGFWMGIALGDIDNDGDQDVLFTNAGSSIPAFLTRGDLQEHQQQNLNWALWRNDGGFNFTDITTEFGINKEGFAWGAVFEDLNLDGRLDLLVAQNYLKWPVHKLFKLDGLTSLQTRDGRFAHISDLNLENPYFGQSPLIVDLNQDHKPDVVWINMDGPVRAFLNQSELEPVVVKVPEQASYLGAKVTLTGDNGQSYTREVTVGSGMSTDHSSDLVFALEQGGQPKEIQVIYPNGKKTVVPVSDGHRLIILGAE